MATQASFFAGRSVVVTGAGGFIGSHVCRRLAVEGAVVHAMVRRAGSRRLTHVARTTNPGRSSRTTSSPGGSVTEWELDVTAAEPIRERFATARPEIVIHLAGDTTARRFDGDWAAIDRALAVNLWGTLNVVRAAIDSDTVRVVIRAGGLEEYGTGATPYDESQREQPVSPYSASQVAATHITEMLQQHTPIALVTLRPALVYGPAQSTDFFIPALIDNCLRGIDFDMSDGEQRRDVVYIDDLVDAILAAASAVDLRDGIDLRGAVINVGHGVEHRMVDIARLIVRLTSTDATVRIGARPRRTGDLEHLVAKTDVATSMLGWHPRVTLAEGLSRTIDWCRAEIGAQAER